MSDLLVTYLGESTRLHSKKLWKDAPIKQVMSGDCDGTYLFDDFINFPSHSTTTVINNYTSYLDTGGTLVQSATESVGAAILDSDGTAADAITLATGGNAGGLLSIPASPTAKVWFEARIKVSSIAANAPAIFLGFMQEGSFSGTAGVVAAGGAAPADNDFLGFFRPANTNVFKFGYLVEGQTAQFPMTSMHTLVADTYVKLGFYLNPEDVPAKRLKAFVNGTEFTTYITAANIADVAGADQFPSDQEMALTLALKQDATGLDSTATIDWWAFMQMG